MANHDNDLVDVRSIRQEISRHCLDRPEEVLDFYQEAQDRLKAQGTFAFYCTPLNGTTADTRVDPPDSSA